MYGRSTNGEAVLSLRVALVRYFIAQSINYYGKSLRSHIYTKVDRERCRRSKGQTKAWEAINFTLNILSTTMGRPRIYSTPEE